MKRWLWIPGASLALLASARAGATVIPPPPPPPCLRIDGPVFLGTLMALPDRQGRVAVRVDRVLQGTLAKRTYRLPYAYASGCSRRETPPRPRAGEQRVIYLAPQSGEMRAITWADPIDVVIFDKRFEPALPEFKSLLDQEQLRQHKIDERKFGGAVPRGTPSNWLNSDDYPSAALRDRIEGLVQLKLTVDETGRVRECKVERSSGSRLLDESSCTTITRRARYKPPTAGRAQVRFEHRWRLPEADGNR